MRENVQPKMKYFNLEIFNEFEFIPTSHLYILACTQEGWNNIFPEEL